MTENQNSKEKNYSFLKPVAIAALCTAVIIGGYFVTEHQVPPPGETPGMVSNLPVEKAVFETQNGDKHEVDLEVATRPVDLEMGLMFRKEMAKDHGMLFEMGRTPAPTSFWMKNTYIPLDIIYIDETGHIINIARNAVPKSLTSISSGGPVTGVIELNGGRADELGLRVGDKVNHPYFNQAANK